MRRPHLTNPINPQIVEAARELFDAGAWNAEDEVLKERYNKFLQDACMGSSLEQKPPVYIKRGNIFGHLLDYCCIRDTEIHYKKYSVITMFHGLHHLMNHQDSTSIYSTAVESEAQAFALGVFYQADPKRFRRSVRNGLITGVYPEHLIRSDAPVSLCIHCEENVWQAQSGKWRHVDTGRLHCDGMESPLASPMNQDVV